MVASIAITLPHNTDTISAGVGYFSFGVMIAVAAGLFYSVLTLKGNSKPEVMVLQKNLYANITESVIFGCMVGIALLVAQLLKLENPYWVPTSCMAVMQGITTRHIFLRAVQRVLGTFLGLGLVWLILQLNITILGICISILILQTIVEFLVVRNYTFATIFITMLTIFLAEPNVNLLTDTNELISARFFDILAGSIIGALGGWMLYHERIQYFSRKQLRRTRIMVNRYRQDFDKNKNKKH